MLSLMQILITFEVIDLVIPNYAAVHAVDDTFAKEFVESFL